jgi:hypothetical protein
MKKKSNKELGIVIPESMVDVIDNRDLTDEQVGRIVRAITWNSMEYAGKDMVVKTLAGTLVNTFKTANRIRIERIKASREYKKEYERRQRERAKMVEDAALKAAAKSIEIHGTSMDIHGDIGSNIIRDNISPYNPPAGDEKDSSAKLDDHAQTGSPSKGRRTRPSARPTARNTSTSGDSRERPATSSKKTGGVFTEEQVARMNKRVQGRGTRWPEGDALVETAKRMVARHPNTKSNLRAVVRALRSFDDPAALEAAHAAWCATDEWKPDKGQFVQSLAKWIDNGGWARLPPEKKPARPKAAREEMSFGASL